MSDQQLQNKVGQAPQTTTAAPRTPALWFTLGQLLLGLALLRALGNYFRPTFLDLVTKIANSDNYSSGLLIPFLIAYIVYRKWPELRQPWQPSWWGLAVLALGFGMFFLGAVFTIEYISWLSHSFDSSRGIMAAGRLAAGAANELSPPAAGPGYSPAAFYYQ